MAAGSAAPPEKPAPKRRRSRSRGGGAGRAEAEGSSAAVPKPEPEGIGSAAAADGGVAAPPAGLTVKAQAVPGAEAPSAEPTRAARRRRSRSQGTAARSEATFVGLETGAGARVEAAGEWAPPSLAAPEPVPPSLPAFPAVPQAPSVASRYDVELTAEERDRLDALGVRLDIRFRHPALLREAMTHASWNNERGEPSGPGHDNERLEYLGDAVLELVTGEYLFKRFPGYDEGQLTQLRASLVNTVSLAKLADRLALGDALLLGKGAAKTGARQLPSLLANAFEAMIGAIFLDQGYRVATRVFLQSVGDLAEWSDQNHKGKLQEAAQLRLGATPSYRVTSVAGPGHRREYRAEALVGGVALGDGRGSTKQAAEQAAARMALARLAPGDGIAAGGRVAQRKAAASTEPARVRRRVAEVAADRRAVKGGGARGVPAPAPAPAPGVVPPPRQRGWLSLLRSAAGGLLGHRPPEAAAAPPPEPAATARKRTRRGHRGGRGRRRPTPPAGPAS